MSVVTRAWEWWGRLPAVGVVIGLFGLAFATITGLDDATASTIGVVLLAALIASCVARPSDGADLFWLVSAPNAISVIAHETVGAPLWIATVLLPFVVYGAWCLDHPTVAADSSPAATAGAPTIE